MINDLPLPFTCFKEIIESKIRLKSGIPIDNELYKELKEISNN